MKDATSAPVSLDTSSPDTRLPDCALLFECPAHLAAKFRIVSASAAVRSVVVTADLTHPRLRAVLESHRDPVLLVGLFGDHIILALAGNEHVCLECLTYWIRTARGDTSGALHVAVEPTIDVLESSITLMIEALRAWMTSALSGNGTTVVHVDRHTAAISRHAVVRRLDCRECQGLFRVQTGFTAHYSPLTGIVRDVVAVPSRVNGVFVASARFVLPLRDGSARPEGTQMSFGRGRTLQEAEEGCIGEALEAYGAASRGAERTTRCAIGDLPHAVDPRTVLLFSESQYSNRHRLNARRAFRHRVPERFDSAQHIEWVWGYELASGQEVAIPATLCFRHHPYRAGDARFAVADMTGCGAGRTVTEALLHGLLECIERDAVAIWWYNRVVRPSVRLESFDHATLPALNQSMFRVDRRIVVLDVTTDLGIATYVAVLTTTDGREPIFGAAAHPIPSIAAWKAMSEAVLNWHCSETVSLPFDIRSWCSSTDVADHPHLRGSGEVAAQAGEERVDATRCLDRLVERLQARGLRPIAFHFDRPDTLVPTVRVLVPGLRRVCDSRAPGRLYDVPATLRWSEAALTERDLNPIPCTW